MEGRKDSLVYLTEGLPRQLVVVRHIAERCHDRKLAVFPPLVVGRQPVVTTPLDVKGHKVKAVSSVVLEKMVLDFFREKAVNLFRKHKSNCTSLLLWLSRSVTKHSYARIIT